MRIQNFFCAAVVAAALTAAVSGVGPRVADYVSVLPDQQHKFTVRTENYPRPPYSGATYYIYEQDDKVVCTKLETCNKFGNCSSVYKKGSFKDPEDVETGEAYGHTDAVVIPTAKLRKHTCLTKFKLVP